MGMISRDSVVMKSGGLDDDRTEFRIFKYIAVNSY